MLTDIMGPDIVDLPKEMCLAPTSLIATACPAIHSDNCGTNWYNSRMFDGDTCQNVAYPET